MTTIERIIDAATGEVTDRPLTPDELSQRADDAQAAAAENAATHAARNAALTKLAALGLTVDDLTALGL